MKKWLPALFLCLLPCILFCETLQIRNNSNTRLNATIYDKSEVMVSVILAPGQTYRWNDNPRSANNLRSGPFSIVFTCQNGSTWGTIRHANWGFSYNASAAIGSKSCR